jgi:hypothetical protein
MLQLCLPVNYLLLLLFGFVDRNYTIRYVLVVGVFLLWAVALILSHIVEDDTRM